jgi:hypothetical protein
MSRVARSQPTPAHSTPVKPSGIQKKGGYSGTKPAASMGTPPKIPPAAKQPK